MANLGTRPGDVARLIVLLKRYGMEASLSAETAAVPQGGRFVPGTGPRRPSGQGPHPMEAVQRFVRAFTYENVPWREAQEAGMLWAPLRKPHENALDPHWLARHSCTDVEHPELGRSFRYATSKWLGTATSWSVGRRAPLLNEDAQTVCHPAAAHRAGDRERRAGASRPRGSRRTASRSRCMASASWTSPGSWPPPAARGSSAPLAPRASRSS